MEGVRYERTGEFRAPRKDEWYEGFCPKSGYGEPCSAGRDFQSGDRFWILRRVEPAVASAPERTLVQIARDAIEDVENLRANDKDLVTKFPGTYCTEQTFEAHVDEAFRRVLIHLEDLKAVLLDSDAGREGGTT
jgi:hypothetical protein